MEIAASLKTQKWQSIHQRKFILRQAVARSLDGDDSLVSCLYQIRFLLFWAEFLQRLCLTIEKYLHMTKILSLTLTFRNRYTHQQPHYILLTVIKFIYTLKIMQFC